MQLVYVGADGKGSAGMGLSALVRPLSNDTDARMRDGLVQVLAAIDLLEEPLLTSIAADPAPAQTTYRRLKELQRVLNTEVVSLLGVTVGFSDSDGDGG
jgi:predicted lipoprotein